MNGEDLLVSMLVLVGLPAIGFVLLAATTQTNPPPVVARSVVAQAQTVMALSDVPVLQWTGVTIPKLSDAQWKTLTNAFPAYLTNKTLIYNAP